MFVETSLYYSQIQIHIQEYFVPMYNSQKTTETCTQVALVNRSLEIWGFDYLQTRIQWKPQKEGNNPVLA